MAEIFCAVCIESFSGQDDNLYPYILPCSHIFHLKCIESCKSECGNFCPVCRRDYKDLINEAKKHDLFAMKVEKAKEMKQEEKEYQILLKDLTTKSFLINVCYNFTETKLYEIVSAISGIAINQFRLSTGIKNLNYEGTRMLIDLEIGPQSQIMLLLRLKG